MWHINPIIPMSDTTTTHRPATTVVTATSEQLEASLPILELMAVRDDVPPRLAYRLGRTLVAVRNEVRAAAEARETQLAAFAKKHDDGAPVLRPVQTPRGTVQTFVWASPDHEANAVRTATELLRAPVDVRVFTVGVSDLDALRSVPPAFYDTCSYLIHDLDPDVAATADAGE